MDASHRPKAVVAAGARRSSRASATLIAWVIGSACVAGPGCFLDRNPVRVGDPSGDSGQVDSGRVSDAEAEPDGGRLVDGGAIDAAEPELPGPPGAPTYSDLEPTSVRVSWTTPTTGGPVQSYRLLRSTDPEQAGALVADGLVEPTALQEGLRTDTTYWFRAQATNGAGHGPMSEPTRVTLRSPLVITRRQRMSERRNNHQVDFPNDPLPGSLLVVIATHRRTEAEGEPEIAQGGWTRRVRERVGGSYRRGLSVWSKVAGENEPRRVTVVWPPGGDINQSRLIVQELVARAPGTWVFVDGASRLGSGRRIASGVTDSIDDAELLLVGAYGCRAGSGAVTFEGLGEPFYRSDEVSAATAFAQRTEGGIFSTAANSGNARYGAVALLVFRFEYPD